MNDNKEVLFCRVILAELESCWKKARETECSLIKISSTVGQVRIILQIFEKMVDAGLLSENSKKEVLEKLQEMICANEGRRAAGVDLMEKLLAKLL